MDHDVTRRARARSRRRLCLRLPLALLVLLGALLLTAGPADAAPRLTALRTGTVLVVGTAAEVTAPTGPTAPTAPSTKSASGGSDVSVSLPGKPSSVVTIILLVTVLSVAPAVLLMCTAFTKIVVVLSLTRSAIGTQSVPPNQVLVGLALFLSLFVMGPTFSAVQKDGVAPYLAGTKSLQQAYDDGSVPLRDFMLKHTRDEELALMAKSSGTTLPTDREDVDLTTLIPAFILSELRGAFIIGFVIFIPFLVVDIVVSAILMSLGMVMLPPSLISLPFKLLLFVLLDGWSLIVTTLIGSYR